MGEVNREFIVSQAKEKALAISSLPSMADVHDSSLESKLIRSASLYEAFMQSVGMETNDANSNETAYRVSKMFHLETCSSLKQKKPEVTTFPNDGKYNQYVVVNNLDYFSLCSHHHLPFYGNAYIAYHPDKLLCGLSKLHRVVTYFSKKPQLQERMTQEIIDFLWETLNPVGIMVVITGTHLCMCARGTKAQKDSLTITSSIKGESNGFDKNEAMKLFEIKSH